MRFRAVAVAALAVAGAYAHAGISAKTQAAFDSCKRLVGGVWRGTVGEKLPVELRFTLSPDGNVITGTGLVGDPTKPVLRIESIVGLDAVTDSVYYLDRHNTDTVYFGHVTLEGEKLKFDFTSLVGGKGHWIATEWLPTADTFRSSMLSVKEDGTTVEEPVHLSLRHVEK